MSSGKKRRKRAATTGCRADERASAAGQHHPPAAPIVPLPVHLAIAFATLWKAALDGVLTAAQTMTSPMPAPSARPAALATRLDEIAGLARSKVIDFAAYRARRMIR